MGQVIKKSGFEVDRALVPYLELKWDIERTVGFFQSRRLRGLDQQH